MNKQVLRLYVAGSLPNSVVAIRKLEAICTRLPSGTFEVEVVDVLARPRAASAADIVIAPTLVVTFASGRTSRLVGPLNDSEQLRELLGA